MKHGKMPVLLLAAAAALTAFAGSASAAPVLTSPAGTEYTGTIEATMAPGTSSVFKAGVEDTCVESTVSGTISTNTEVHAAGSGSVNTGNCTQDTKTVTGGSLTVDDKGTIFAEGSRVEVKVTSLGITCFYGAESGKVDIGTLTPGTPATIDINTTELQRETGSNTFFCASRGTWTSKYVVTTPSSLFIT